MIELKANNIPTHDGWYIYRGTKATELVKVDFNAGLLWSDVISFEEYHGNR